MFRVRYHRLIPLLVGVVFVGACSSCSKGDTTTATGSPASPAAATGTSSSTGDKTGNTGAAGSVKVALADSSLGRILVDASGNTLYAFTKDTATKSACTASCSALWPAVTGASVDPGPGLGEDDFTVIAGEGGASQIVFYGHPLYLYAKDTKPGDTNGQGVGGVWFVVDAQGNPVSAPATQTSTTKAGGY
jgi:predicted lipoprotein with Yx(FWY)xxD motif